MYLVFCRVHWGELALILHIFKVIQANADCQAQSQCLSEFCHLTLASSTYDNRMIRIRNPFVLEQCWTRLQLSVQGASLYICSAKWKRMFCNFITKPGRDFILESQIFEKQPDSQRSYEKHAPKRRPNSSLLFPPSAQQHGPSLPAPSRESRSLPNAYIWGNHAGFSLA